MNVMNEYGLAMHVWCCDVFRFDHMSEVWNLLKSSLPEFTLPEPPSDTSVEAMQPSSLVSSSDATVWPMFSRMS